MLNSTSVKTRFLISIASNATRASIGFFSGLLVARGLNPSGYGDLTFLLGSFAAIRTLLDMGSSSAFYTFISQRRQRRHFYIYYFGWLALQFVIIFLLVALILPQAMIANVWLDHSRGVILLSFAASFMQQQVWQTISQIGEASRKTVRVQVISMAVGITHLAIISLFLVNGRLSIELIFFLLIGEYFLATVWACRFLREKQGTADAQDSIELSFSQMLKEYVRYCKPLILLSWIGFFYEFVDRWMLQRFGGANQQGFYQIAYQFSAVSLLATSSILNVFWKEIAEAHRRGDEKRVSVIYRKLNRGLVMFGAILSGLLIPWTEQIVAVFLGQAYSMAVPVLMILFLFPIHQSMGQVGGTMLLASGDTYAYMVISGCLMLVSLPLSYLVQAPPSGFLVPGLGMGAVGMALKMVLLNIVSVNVQAWVISRHHKWKYDWLYQVVGIGSVIAIGYASKFAVGIFCNLNIGTDKIQLIFPFLLTSVIYGLSVMGFIWFMPWVVGMDRIRVKEIFTKLKFT